MMPGSATPVYRLWGATGSRWAAASVLCVALVGRGEDADARAREVADTTTAVQRAAAVPAISIDADPRAGLATVSWRPGAAADATDPECQLQSARRADFSDERERYRGSHRASVLSGLPEGVHRFRVRCRAARGYWGAWSEPASVEIAYHSSGLAGLLFGLGALVFGLTAGFLMGARSVEWAND